MVLVINYASVVSVGVSSSFGASSVFTSSTLTSSLISSVFTSSTFSSTLGVSFLAGAELPKFESHSSVSFFAAASKNLASAETGDIILQTSLPSNTSLLGIEAITLVSSASFTVHSK